MKTAVLGSGISGIGAAYKLKKNKIKSQVFEKNKNWGGLIDNFSIEGFRFDKFIHLSFAKEKSVNDIFLKTEFNSHDPLAYNYYKGLMIKHPAITNLYPLTNIEKNLIINDYRNRPNFLIYNYDDWLRNNYGNYFTDNFFVPYTEKYWTVSAKSLETKWINDRIYIPTIEEVVKGSKNKTTPNHYYADKMRYPKKGGYKSFVKPMTKDLNFNFNHKVTSIDINHKIIFFSNGKSYKYDNLISSLPLTELPNMILDAPTEIIKASNNLKYTSGHLISLGFNKPDIPKKLWFYIYDKNILPSRIYSPSIKSADNVPKGCSSIQAEIYYSENSVQNDDKQIILKKTIKQLINMGLFKQEDLIVKDIRSEKYANVIFDNNIYENRDIIKNFLESNDIISIGRFGEWKYLWSNQSLISGFNGADKIISKTDFKNK